MIANNSNAPLQLRQGMEENRNKFHKLWTFDFCPQRSNENVNVQTRKTAISAKKKWFIISPEINAESTLPAVRTILIEKESMLSSSFGWHCKSWYFLDKFSQSIYLPFIVLRDMDTWIIIQNLAISFIINSIDAAFRSSHTRETTRLIKN